MEEKLKQILQRIMPADADALSLAEQRQAALAKPPGSLGKLESISVKMAGITGKVINEPKKTRLVVFAADNGVVEEGVSSAPQSVTLSQTVNLTRGITGASALAAHVGAEVEVVDVGVKTAVNCAAVYDRKIACGTQNICKGPAMTRDQAIKAMLTGVEFADKAAEDGMDIVGCGEMGIGNTTTSAAVLCVLTGRPAAELTGKGGGITQDAYRKKIKVIETAIGKNHPDPDDVVDILAKVGGFDLCAMTGFFLGCAKNRIPVVVDGIISVTAALAAVRMQKNTKHYLFLSHKSFEKGYQAAAMELGMETYLDMDMRLGEGSGCPIMFQVISAACAVMKNMATFMQAEINDDYLEEIREGDCFTVTEE